jgi:hypothetical protein
LIRRLVIHPPVKKFWRPLRQFAELLFARLTRLDEARLWDFRHQSTDGIFLSVGTGGAYGVS